MSEPDIVRVSLSPAASANALARSALRLCAHALGVRHVIVGSGARADVYYGEADLGDGSVWLPYWPECYEPSQGHVAVNDGSLSLWVPDTRRDERPIDIIGGIARLVAMLDESQIADSARTAGGVFRLAALPLARREVHAELLVEWHIAALLERLELGGLHLAGRLPRWPRGATHAVVLTHDVDGAGLHDPRELLRTAVRGIRYRSPGMLRGSAAGLVGWIRRRPDPHFQFGGWAKRERRLGVRSAFLVHSPAGAPRHINDPTYTVSEAPQWRVLRELADEGWEIGVHAGIHAARSATFLAGERERLERILGRPVSGLRHHYWRLDWRDPTQTFRMHVDAGYKYDMSIAWRNAYGFRAGTSLPYQPFDGRGGALDLVEIPTAVMDSNLFEHLRLSAADAADTIRHLAADVRRAGGVINLNWHQENYWNVYANAGWRTVYEEAVEELAADSSAWIATPGEIASWWRDRAQRLG